VSRYDGHSWQNYTTEDGLTSNYTRSIAEDSQGRFWFGAAYDGASRFDGDLWQSFLMNGGFQANEVPSILSDTKGDIWFGTNEGIRRFDGNDWIVFTSPDIWPINLVFLIGVGMAPTFLLVALFYTLFRRFKRERYLLLSWRTIALFPIAWVVAVLFHGINYALFFDHFRRIGGDEPVFFILALIVIPLFFVAALIYTVAVKARRMMSNRTATGV